MGLALTIITAAIIVAFLVWWTCIHFLGKKTIIPKIYTNTEYPQWDPEDINVSVDVVAVDSEKMMSIAFYCFENEHWYFISDKDPYVKGKLIDFVWMYKPKNFEL